MRFRYISISLLSSPSTEEENHWWLVFVFIYTCLKPEVWISNYHKKLERSIWAHYTDTVCLSKLGSYSGFTQDIIITTTTLVPNRVKKLRFGSNWSF